MTPVDFLRPKAQTSVRFATQPFQASWQEGVVRHSSHHFPVVSATIGASPPTQFSRKNQADFRISQTDMTGHNFTYDRTQQVRANHLNILDGKNSGLSSRQQPSGYGDLLRDDSDPLIPKPNVKRVEGDPLDYWAFYNRFRCHVADWLPSKTKMFYLLQHCSTQVYNNIQHFADIHHRQYSYDLAWDKLKRRYGAASCHCSSL